MNLDEQWLKLADASRFLGVSEITLRRRVRSGKIRTKFEDGKYFVCVSDAQGVSEVAPVRSILPKTSSFIKTSTERLSEQLQEELFVLQGRNAELEKIVIQQKRQIEDQLTLIKALEDSLQMM